MTAVILAVDHEPHHQATSELPFVSVMTLTYGRPALLEEAIESFLRQDYLGRKEMVVFNSCPEQVLSCDAPGVRVINWPERPGSLGECRNLCVERCAGTHVLTLDDDDIILPHYMRMSVDALLAGGLEWVKVGHLVWMVDRQIEYIRGPAMNQLLFAREAWERSGGYPAIDCGEDLGFEARLIDCARGRREARPREQAGYLYGWGGHDGQTIHASEELPSGDPMRAFVQDLVRTGRLAEGEVRLSPRWHRDYRARFAAWLEQHPPHAEALEGFGGDQHLFDAIGALVERHGLRSVIALGAPPGATSQALAALAPQVACLDGGGPQAFERVLSTSTPPYLFLLDAREEAGWTVREGLAAIQAARCRPVIVIRDVEAPGSLDGHWFRDHVRAFVEAIYGAKGYSRRGIARATGERRGVLILEP